MMTGRAFAGASASDRRNCSLNLDASPPAVQTYPANPSSEGGALAAFTWTGQVSCIAEGCECQA
jgi:hypothetical protein